MTPIQSIALPLASFAFAASVTLVIVVAWIGMLVVVRRDVRRLRGEIREMIAKREKERGE